MKKLHYFDFEQQKLRKYPESDEKLIDSCLLTKYFPKYQKEFLLTNHNGAVRSKIKRVKIIKSFVTYPGFRERPDWRVLLSSKMKSLRVLENETEPAKQFADKLKFFSGLKSVQISTQHPEFRYNASQNQRERFFFPIACKKLGHLQNLEHLEINPISRGSKEYLSKLNSHRKLLDSLKTLKIYFNWKDASDSEILELTENSENLLRNVTFLELSLLHSPFHFESFQRLGELCRRISTLTFQFSCREPIYHTFLPTKFSDQCFEVKTNYLQTLRAFQSLKYLGLSIIDTFTFLRDFALPPSVQFLKLTFEECLSHEIMLKIDNNFIGSTEEELSKTFEENNLLLMFYENFRDLQNLETLELFFSLDSNTKAYKYQSYLSQSLLKRISSPLKNLKILPTALSSGLSKAPVFEMQDPYLPQLIESCENFASTLETLELGSPKVMYSKFDLSAYRNKFTNLSYIEIKAKFQDSEIETLGSFLKSLISLGQESVGRIKLGVYMDRRAKSMLSLLQQVNLLQKPNQLKIGIELYLINLKGIIEEARVSFAEGINELRNSESSFSRAEGVFLKLFEGFVTSNEYKAFVKLYKDRFYPF